MIILQQLSKREELASQLLQCWVLDLNNKVQRYISTVKVLYYILQKANYARIAVLLLDDRMQ